MSAKNVFVREATGLVKEVSILDALIGNIIVFNLVIAAVTIMVIPYTFPGSNLPLSVLLTFPLALCLALIYVLFGMAMPRSGGDYVYISRVLHPALGFAANFNITIWTALWIGVYSNWFTTIGLSGTFSTLGALLTRPDLLGLGSTIVQPVPSILIGTAVNVLVAALVISGLKRALTAQKIIFIISIIGVGLVILVLAITPHEAFVQRFDQLASYNGIIETASQNGFSTVSDWNQLGPTLGASLLVALSLMFAQSSQWIGGELKDAKKNVPVSIIGCLVVGTIGMYLLATVAVSTFGPDFMAAIQYVYYAVPGKYPLSVPPSYNLLASIGFPNLIVIVIIGLGFTLWSVGVIIFDQLIVSRCVLSWSFDRVFPKKFAEVNSRWSTPVPAIALAAAIAEIFLIYYSYNPTVSFLAGSTLGYMLGFATLAVAAVPFPYKLKKIYENSPAKRSVGGIPVISILGIVTIVYFVFLIYTYLVNPVFGANAPQGIFFMVFLWIIGFVIFYVAKFYNKRNGVDLDLVFKEIPPE
jgi:amino acid transporter